MPPSVGLNFDQYDKIPVTRSGAGVSEVEFPQLGPDFGAAAGETIAPGIPDLQSTSFLDRIFPPVGNACMVGRARNSGWSGGCGDERKDELPWERKQRGASLKTEGKGGQHRAISS